MHLRYGEPGMALALEFFGPLGKRTDDAMAGFSDEDLALVRRFLAGMNDALAEHHAEVRAAQ